VNASRTVVESRLTIDSELHEDVSLIAQMVFARAGRPDAATRHVALMPRETLELDLSDPAQRIFGDYELLELIGEGGMGVVYRARQISLDREVAVKLLAAGPWASAEFVERFRREAQNAARMQHPNIVAIFEVGTAEDLQFFSMRLVRGESLAALLRRDRVLAPQRAAQLLRTIAEAVDYAHRLGVLHLDLKPANVLMDETGIPHVADFGLARRLDQDAAAENDEVSGTPSYMAPEQAVTRGQITCATDIWGLGAVLYELVCGKPPFLGSTPQGTLQLVVGGTVESPRRHRADLPRDLEAIVLKCMSRDVTQRYASGRALADDLTRFIEGREVRARPLNRLQRTARWARREPKFATAALLAALALVAGLAATTHQWQRAEQARQIAQSNATTSAERLWEGRRDIAMRLMGDGKGFEALTPLIDNVEEQERAGLDDPRSVERRELGMIERLGVTLIDRTIVPGAPLSAAAISPDGDLFAVALGDGTVHWFDTATMTERGHVDVSGEPTSDDQERAVRLLRFVDSHRLRVTLDWADYFMNPTDLDMVMVDLDQARILRPTAFATFAHAEFSADGEYALLHNRSRKMQLWHVAPWQPISPLVPEGDGKDTAQGLILGRGGRYAVSIKDRLAALELFDPRRMSAPQRVDLPSDTTLWSWAESPNGEHLALGDTNGHVYLLDLATRTLRKLPASRGREVTWLEFSEDGAWLAAARMDGEAFAFDAATGEPLSTGTMAQPFPLRHVQINHRERLLVALGPGDLAPAYPAIWRLAEPGSSAAVAASRIISVPNAGRMGFFTAPMSERNGLLVTATTEGNVRLWRLPRSPLLSARSSRQASDTLHYDGSHIVDAAQTKLRVASTTGDAPTRWVDLPQPVNFAEMSSSGKTLVAISGHELRVFDPATMQERQTPVELPATPLHLVVDETGNLVFMTFGHNGPDGFAEVVQACDLATGRLLPARAAVRGSLRKFEFTADAAHLITVGPVDGTTDIFDPATLTRVGGYQHVRDMPVISAALQADGNNERDRLLVVTDTSSTSVFDAGNGVLVVDPSSGRVTEQLPTSSLRPLSVVAASGHVFVAGRLGDAVDPASRTQLRRNTNWRPDTRSVASISRGGRLIARAFRSEVQIYDAASGAVVGTRLVAELDPMDDIAQLAFGPDDRELLARTRLNRWVLWTLEADDRPLTALRGDEHLLNPDPAVEGPILAVMPDSSEHAALRARDPGPPPRAEPRPVAKATRYIEGIPVPARTATDPLLLDLTESYSLAPDSVQNFNTLSAPDMSGVPIGVIRADGVDYDLRGLTELGQKAFTASVSSSMTGIKVPAVPLAAVHILMFASQATPSPEEHTYANLRLHYADGTMALVPIRAQVDVPGYSDSDKPTPFAMTFGSSERLQGNSIVAMISNPRLPNPHPERIVRSLDISTVTDEWSEPAIFAITAEPVIGGLPRRMDPKEGTINPREEVP
jgi:WD40 repeat protein